MQRSALHLPGSIAAHPAAAEIIFTVAEAIEELGSVPSGHLYANLIGHLSLDSYTAIISILKANNLVRESNHLLTWVGIKS